MAVGQRALRGRELLRQPRAPIAVAAGEGGGPLQRERADLAGRCCERLAARLVLLERVLRSAERVRCLAAALVSARDRLLGVLSRGTPPIEQRTQRARAARLARRARLAVHASLPCHSGSRATAVPRKVSPRLAFGAGSHTPSMLSVLICSARRSPSSSVKSSEPLSVA